jgi:hypothetical protein
MMDKYDARRGPRPCLPTSTQLNSHDPYIA